MTVKNTMAATHIRVRMMTGFKSGFASKSRKFVSPVKPPKLPALLMSVNEARTSSTTGQMTTTKIRIKAGPIHGSAARTLLLWAELRFLPLAFDSLARSVFTMDNYSVPFVSHHDLSKRGFGSLTHEAPPLVGLTGYYLVPAFTALA